MTSNPGWFRLPLTALLPEQPTYFTGSVLGPAAERALAAAYRGFDAPLAGAPVVWHADQRRAALNDGLLAAADQALRQSLEESSGLGRLFGGGQGRRAEALIAETLTATPEQIARIDRWWQRVRGMEWRQATVLQIMEELEPRAEEALAAQQRVALSLALALHLLASAARPDAAPVVADLSAGIDDSLPSAAHTTARLALAEALRDAGSAALRGDAQEGPDAQRQPLETFLARFGQWGESPLETARPRWADDPARLLETPPSPPVDSTASSRRSAAAALVIQPLTGQRRRKATAAAAQVEELARLLPQIHGAVVTVAAAARYWVSGAAREGLADGRLQNADEVFLLELEELKQMMTGEWSNVEQVRPIVEARGEAGGT